MENNGNMNAPVNSANAPVSRNWLPIIIIVAIVVIGLVAWGMSRDNDDNTMSGNDSNSMVNDNNRMMADDNNVNTNGDMNNEANDTNGAMDKDEGEMGVNNGMEANVQHSIPSGTMIPAMREEAGVKIITVVGGDFYFGPGEIKVKKGDKVKIVFDNKEGFHDFVLDEFNVKTKQMKGPDVQEVTFTADKVGTFEYYCSVGKHRAMGMKGNLIVE